ncbi:hypothetical protein M501DRAFT_992864 [Patellaria atrata CBS 101060]|uniref:Uncharacterized protein n=1 Tax=Patellaria atrata CBS 101060 TaxID=1346257 RepID=A0A9P4SC57_9PEZI|nr:hypothetical protein M501DRAFT_992864 [Patellaria atrata CBS 101060]
MPEHMEWPETIDPRLNPAFASPLRPTASTPTDPDSTRIDSVQPIDGIVEPFPEKWDSAPRPDILTESGVTSDFGKLDGFDLAKILNSASGFKLNGELLTLDGMDNTLFDGTQQYDFSEFNESQPGSGTDDASQVITTDLGNNTQQDAVADSQTSYTTSVS